MSAIPIFWLDFGNGALICALAWMMAFFVVILRRRRVLYDSWWDTYRGSKPYIALLVLVLGFWSRSVVLWGGRRLARAHVDVDEYRWAIVLTLLATTLLALLGAMCWTRVSSSLRLPRWVLVVVFATCVAFGVLFAL